MKEHFPLPAAFLCAFCAVGFLVGAWALAEALVVHAWVSAAIVGALTTVFAILLVDTLHHPDQYR